MTSLSIGQLDQINGLKLRGAHRAIPTTVFFRACGASGATWGSIPCRRDSIVQFGHIQEGRRMTCGPQELSVYNHRITMDLRHATQ